MKQAYKKRPSRATTFCMPVLLDMGNYFINLVNIVRYIRYVLYINIIEFCVSRQENKTGTKSIF